MVFDRRLRGSKIFSCSLPYLRRIFLAIHAIASSELSLVQFGLSMGGNILCVLVMAVAITRHFNNEKVMLNA